MNSGFLHMTQPTVLASRQSGVMQGTITMVGHHDTLQQAHQKDRTCICLPSRLASHVSDADCTLREVVKVLTSVRSSSCPDALH